MKRNNKGYIIGLILAVLASGAAGFFAGKNVTGRQYRAERELEIRLNRSDLEGLGEVEGPIYVTGHKSPDADTVGSSIGYAALLRALGYDAQPVVLGKINNQTKYILEAAGLDTPMLLEDASGCNMVLVDHSEYTQSAEGLEDAYIVSVIDHHAAGSITTGNQLIYDARPLGATATIVWLRYRDYGIEPDRQTACAMMGSILSDTKNLQSSVTAADREALKALSALAGIHDTDAFYAEMYKASLSYEGMSDEEILFSDYKEYETDGTKYAIGCISAYDEETARDLAARMINVFPAALASSGMDFMFAQINIFHDDLDITYIVPSGKGAYEVLDSAFSVNAEIMSTATFDGNCCRIEPGISRKKVLVPALTDVLQAHPKE